jgi:hypothetical protein
MMSKPGSQHGKLFLAAKSKLCEFALVRQAGPVGRRTKRKPKDDFTAKVTKSRRGIATINGKTG